MKQKITIKQIAQTLGVSISTVSKALNDSHEISLKTKEKIQAYAKEHNYKPNTNAVNLKNRSSKTIGIIIPNMLNHFFAQVFSGAEKIANERGYKVITCITNESHAKEVETMEMLSNGSIDGFMMSIAEETQIGRKYNHLKDAIEQGTPLVMFDRVTDAVDCDKVITDDFEGAYHATDHLIKLQCKNIAFFSTLGDLNIGKYRYNGYLQALADNHIPFNKELVVDLTNVYYKEYGEHIGPLIERLKIDGAIATNEASAISAIYKAKELGLSIPEDISIIGFSNGILSRHSNPKLTTVSQHGELIGKTAATKLIDKLEKKDSPSTTTVIKTSLVERNSTKKYVHLHS
ncbi:LacI family transcriptional regulator [Flavobacteriaceae bacterium]|nr:LacI family transcriptional regulator [Flavobacteriaceae bacterium]